MAAYFPFKQNQPRIQDKGKVDDDVGNDPGAMLDNLFRASIARLRQIQHSKRIHLLSPAYILLTLIPALENSRTGQHRFELAKLVQGGPAPGGVRQAEIPDFSRRPLRTVIDLAAEHDARAHVGPDMNKDEAFLSLRGAAITFPLRGQVGIVLDDDQAVDNLA